MLYLLQVVLLSSSSEAIELKLNYSGANLAICYQLLFHPFVPVTDIPHSSLITVKADRLFKELLACMHRYNMGTFW